MTRFSLRFTAAMAPLPPAATATSPACTGITCQTSTAAATSSAAPPGGMLVVYIVGGVFAVATLGSIALKYRTLGGYYSFWGRIIAIAISGASFAVAWKGYGEWKGNSCVNLQGSADPNDPCPCAACCGVLVCVGLALLAVNLPFLYASDAMTKKMYASYGLAKQASVISTIAAGGAGAVQFLNGSMIQKVLPGSGALVGALMTYGWMRGEDGMFQRMLDAVTEGLDAAGKAAMQAVDAGLGLLGLDSNERKKVTSENIYLHARVQRGPDWTPGNDEDGGETVGGEIYGFNTITGKVEGKEVKKGPGFALVKWDKSEKSPGIFAEYRIGAEDKFDLILTDAADDAGIVGNVVASALGIFGISSAPTQSADGGDQLDMFFTAVSKDKQMSLWLEVFDADSQLKGAANEENKVAFKGAVRYRDLDKNKLAIVVEFGKLPPEATYLVLSARPMPPAKFRDFSGGTLSIQSSGKDIFSLNVDGEHFKKVLAKEGAQEGYIFWIFAKTRGKKDVIDKWFAVSAKDAAFSPGRGGDSVNAVGLQVQKVAARKDIAKDDKSVNIHAAINEIIIVANAEAKAREAINKQIDSLAATFERKFIAAGQPPQIAKALAKKSAGAQYSKAQGDRYQKILKTRVLVHLKQGKPEATAIALAKQDAVHAITFAGDRADLMRVARQEAEQRDKEAEDAKREEQKAAESSIFAGASSLFGMGEAKKKKKKDKE